MSHRLTMSKMSLAHACAYGFRSDVPYTSRPPGPEALIGSMTHKLFELHVKGQPSRADLGGDGDPGLVARALALFNGPARPWIDATQWTACEQGLEYRADLDDAVPCPRRGDAGYEDVAPLSLRGTLDLVRVDGDAAWVYDLKTGKHIDNADQLYAQAVAVSRYYGVSTVHVGYAYVRKTKFDEPSVETLDADRLDYEAGRIGRVLRRLPVSQPERGDWCWRCDSRPHCPAWT